MRPSSPLAALLQQPPVALAIGGSDSGGGAGIQADLKTFALLRVHGCCALTCVTAQNTLGVHRVDALSPASLAAQIDAVFADLPVAALKTGMLLRSDLIVATAAAIAARPVPRLIDPVMVSRAGSVLLEPEAIEAITRLLLPLADLLTPNLREAALLAGLTIESERDVEEAAERIAGLGPKAVLIKGGGLQSLRGSDWFLDEKGGRWLRGPAVDTPHTHGSGCTLAAAITAGLASGLSLAVAIDQARRYVRAGLVHSLAIGAGQGPLCHWHPLLGPGSDSTA
jgi:hydroxymethylpyrimidine/phosphomethylpyrimidine kinase